MVAFNCPRHSREQNPKREDRIFTKADMEWAYAKGLEDGAWVVKKARQLAEESLPSVDEMVKPFSEAAKRIVDECFGCGGGGRE